MPNDKDFSIEDEAYLHAVAAEPKMTTDEIVGVVDQHGYVQDADDGATIDPSTAKGSLAYALDEALSADTDLEHTTVTRDKNDGLDSHLTDPTDDFRDETKGELEGSTDTPQNLLQPIESNKVNEGLKPMIQQDSATPAKESLAYALDSITMDGAEEIEKKPPTGKDPQPDYSDYSEENASHIDFKAPNIPQSMGGDEDKPDANGLVYVSATFTVDPDKYISNNYRPSNTAQAPNAKDVLKKASAGMMGQGQEQQAATPEEEEALSDLGTPEAKESAMQPTEPTEQQEEQAAKDADKEQKKELDAEAEEERKAVIPKASDKAEKPAQDESIDKVVLDYATFIDGSSFMCFDEISDIDYTKIAMDAGPKKPVTRQNCQTTFAQCRAKNPLFCRFHGPKLLEADIKTAIKATVGNGCVVSVTKDSAAKNKFTFRLTVGCPPSKKMMVEKMVHMYLTQNPGITSSTEDWNLAGKHKQTLEFDMDLLRADKPPEKNDIKGKKAVIQTKKDKTAKKVQGVVGETAPALEKKAAKGEKWKSVDEAVESEWADVVDKNVNQSLLANNQEFIDAFNKIANDFDAAHDKGDAEGLKKALDALKAEIGKYDENGEKKPEAATETATSPKTPQEQAQALQATESEAQTQAPEKPTYGKPPKYKGANVDTSSSVSKTTPKSEGTTVDRKVTKEDILDFFGHKTGKMDKADLQKWLELANNGTYNGGSPTEYFDAPSPVYKNVGEGLQKVMEMKGADHPMTKALVKAGLPLPEGMDDSQPAQPSEETEYKRPTNFKGTKTTDVPQDNGGGETQGEHSGNGIDKALHAHIDEITSPDNKDVTFEDIGEAINALQKEYISLGGSNLYNAFDYAVDSMLDPSGADAIGKFLAAKQEKDVEGLKKSLQLLKKGVEAYADMPDADEDADEGNDKGGESGEGVDGGKGFTPPNPMEEPEFYEAWNEAHEPMLNDSFEEAKASIPEGIGNDKIDPLIEDFNKAMGNYDFDGAKKAIEGLKALAGGEGANGKQASKPTDKGDSVKLPAIAPKQKKGSSGKVAEGNSSQPSPQMPKDPKVADLMSKVDELSNKAKELGIDGDEAVANHKKNCAYHIQGVGYSTQNVDHLTAQLQAEEDKPDSPLVELAKTCLTNALQSAKDALESNIKKLENSTQQFADYLDTYQKESMDKAKLSAADSVESSIKNLSAYIFGGKRPPKGVDSVGDYIDYQYDAMQTAAKDGGLSIDELHKMEDTYHVGDAMAATKAASKQMDDLIEEFKDKMDSPPTQSEDYDSYQADIEQMNKSIKAASVELMAAHDAFKTAIEKCNYEAAEAKKLAESKKKLSGGGDQVKPFDFNAWEQQQKKGGEATLGTDGSSGATKTDASSGEVTKEDIMDFFDEDFDESEGEQHALQVWLDLANKGIIGNGKASDYFASMGGWLQQKMQKKGADHPVTKAFHKWGLNLPKGMEAAKEEVKPQQRKQDLSSKVGKPFEGLQNDIKPLISNALSKNGGFTNFDTFDDTSVEGTKHFISMEKKQKEGYDEDYDEEATPTPEELDKLLKQMNEEFSMYGLQVKPSTKMKNSGKNVYFEVEKLDGGKAKQEQAQPKKQLSDEEKKAKIAAMSPKQKLEAAVKIFTKKLANEPNNPELKDKLKKYEAMLSKLNK